MHYKLQVMQVLYKEGGSMGDMYVTDIKRDENGHYVLNAKGGLSMETESSKTYGKYVGNQNAKWQMGWSNTFTWKDLSLSFLINGRIGGKVLSMTESFLDGAGLSQRTADARLYAEKNKIYADAIYGNNILGIRLDDGSGRIVPIESYYNSVGGVTPQDIERYLYSGTNFRLRELSLGYTFRNLFGQNKNLSLSFIARNLFFLYKDAPVDPDVSLSTGPLARYHEDRREQRTDQCTRPLSESGTLPPVSGHSQRTSGIGVHLHEYVRQYAWSRQCRHPAGVESYERATGSESEKGHCFQSDDYVFGD
jgi:hypothetical protein